MDDERSPQPTPDVEGAAPRARTFVVRWWRDSGGTEEEERLRGTVRDISGPSVGAFHGFESLVALLRRHVAPRRDR